MGERCICSVLSLSASPPDFPHCISPCSLQFTQQSNSGPCCNISHPLSNAADFLAFPGPPNSINSIHSPSSSLTPAHSPPTSLHHKHVFCFHPCIYLSWCTMNFAVFTSFPVLALEGATGLLPLPLPTSLPVRLASACLFHKRFTTKVSGFGKLGAFCFP